MIYYGKDIAQYVVTKCAKEDCPISNMQLQKILYYIQRSYAKKGVRLIADDFEAWAWGAVLPTVFYMFCGCGSMPITDDFCKYKAHNPQWEIDRHDKAAIDCIIESKRELAPWETAEELQKKDGAWAQIYQDGRGNRKVIPMELIKLEMKKENDYELES